MTRYELLGLMAAQIQAGLLAGDDGGSQFAGFGSAEKINSLSIHRAVGILDQIEEFEPREHSSDP